MNLKQLWSIFRGRRTNFSWLNASWTYYPDGDPMGKKRETVTIYVPDGYRDAAEFLKDCQFERSKEMQGAPDAKTIAHEISLAVSCDLNPGDADRAAAAVLALSGI